MRKYRIILISLLVIVLIPIIISYFNKDVDSTTKYTEVLSKDRNDDKQWIIISDNKKLYVEDISLWALIEEKQKYTITYYSINKEKSSYRLTAIVPLDYQGQF